MEVSITHVAHQGLANTHTHTHRTTRQTFVSAELDDSGAEGAYCQQIGTCQVLLRLVDTLGLPRFLDISEDKLVVRRTT